MTTVLVIDAGTSETKALVIDPGGRVLARASRKISTRLVGPDGFEQEPEEIWHSVLETGEAAIAQSGREIDAIALANQGESVLAFDPSTARPLTPLITWQDRRADRLCQERADHGDHLAEETGLMLDPYFTAPKLAWLRAGGERRGLVATIDSWLIYKLIGRFATDSATASRSLLVDLQSGRWNGGLLEVFGLGCEQMPDIVPNDEVVGYTSCFGPPLAVTAILDQPAALYAHGCLRPGEAKLTLGTGAFHLCNTGANPPTAPARLTCSTAWEIRRSRTLCTDGQVHHAGSALTWLTRRGLLPCAEALDARSHSEGPGPLVFVPGFTAPGGPRWIGPDDGDGRKVAAVVYGIAAQAADLIDLSPATDLVLRVDGGLTRSTTMVQALADLTQMPVRLYPEADATAQGAAALARLAAGTVDTTSTPDPITATTATDPGLVEPRWSWQQAADYREHYAWAVHAAGREPHEAAR